MKIEDDMEDERNLERINGELVLSVRGIIAANLEEIFTERVLAVTPDNYDKTLDKVSELIEQRIMDKQKEYGQQIVQFMRTVQTDADIIEQEFDLE